MPTFFSRRICGILNRFTDLTPNSRGSGVHFQRVELLGLARPFGGQIHLKESLWPEIQQRERADEQNNRKNGQEEGASRGGGHKRNNVSAEKRFDSVLRNSPPVL